MNRASLKLLRGLPLLFGCLLVACAEDKPGPAETVPAEGGSGGQASAGQGGEPSVGAAGSEASGGGGGASGGSGGATPPMQMADAAAPLPEAGAAGGPASFPDDGLQKDPTFSAGSVPLPAARDDYPAMLSETGLYSDASQEIFAYDVRLFTPQFELWSDTAEKRRWFYIPQGMQIDTSDMDNWTFPIGTKVWKEFARDGKRIETRVLWRVRDGGRGWLAVAYVWNDDQTDAVAAPMGQLDASGTAHDVPSSQLCADCHQERRDWPLGVSAIQLSHDGEGMTLMDLAERELLTMPPEANYVLPGDDVEQAALGYMHANCGHCHRFDTSAAARGDLRTWLLVDQLEDLQSLDAYTYLVNEDVFSGTSVNEKRVVGGAPELSEMLRRMELRGEGDGPMPPVGSEDVDPAGIKAVTDWINALPPPP